jgi:hypothetical protein
MRDHGVSVEFPDVGPGDSFPLPDADFLAAAWLDTSPAGVTPQHPDKAKSVSVAMLRLGIALLWLVPLGGALLLGTAGLGLTVLWQAQPGGPPVEPSVTTSVTTTASQPLASSSTGH